MPQALKAKTKTKRKKPARSKASCREAASKSWQKRRLAAMSPEDRQPMTASFHATVAVMPAPDQPIRGQILDHAKALTLGDRANAYGDPLINFQLASDFKRLFWERRLSQDALSDTPIVPNSRGQAWGHAIDMIFTNLARIATAPTPEAALSSDRYIDISGYAALAYEVGKRS